MLIRLRILLVALWASLACDGQNGKGVIQGKIISADSLPASYVPVGLKGTYYGTTTDDKGLYSFKAPAGRYTLLVQFVGHEPEEKDVTVTEGKTTQIDDLRLRENAKELQEVVVVGKGNKYVDNRASSSLRLVQPLIEVPQNIQIVTTSMLKDQQVISMSDGLIRNVSGLTKFEHWGDLYANIQVRGSQIQAFRNGFNVVGSSWGPLTEDMSFVDKIEFVKGPAGFMLSSGDPAGLYNVVTKKPTGQTKGEASFTMGSYDLYRATLDLDGKLSKNGRLLYRLNLAAQTKKSFRPNEYNDRYVVAPVISYQVDDKTKITAEYNYQRANMSNLGSYYMFSPDGYATYDRSATMLPAGMPGTQVNDHSFYLTLQHNFNKRWKLTGQISKFLYNQTGSSMWAGTINPDGTFVRSVSIWDAKSDLTLGQVFLNGDATTGPVRHRILAGLDMGNKNYLANWYQSYNLDSANAPFDPKNPNLGPPAMGYPNFDHSTPLDQTGATIGFRYSSLYLQDELGFFKNKVRLTLAGRYTYAIQNNYGDYDTAQHFTPRIGLSVSVMKSLAIYALYDQAFIPQGGVLTGGGKVKPVTGNNIELGVKKDWLGGKWSTTFAVYNILKNNQLTPDIRYPNTPLNVELGQIRSQGIEFDLKGTVVKGLDVIANYAYTDAIVTKLAEGAGPVGGTQVKQGESLPGYAKHTINTWLTYKLPGELFKGVGAAAGTTHLIDRTSVGDFYWGAPGAKKMADYFKLDGGLFWENDKMKVTANVFNILDAYLYSGAYYAYAKGYYYQAEAPRNYRLSVNYKF